MTSEREAQWRTAGDRIQTLLDSCAASGAAAYERAQQLVREVVGLYGAGLERIIAAAGGPGLGRAAGHRRPGGQPAPGARPAPARRAPPGVRRAGSGAALPGLARRRRRSARDHRRTTRCGCAFTGSCKSCPSSAVTLELAVEDAVRAAAPEISSIEVVPAEPRHHQRDSRPNRCWRTCVRMGTASNAPGLAPGARAGRAGSPARSAGFVVAGSTVLACRVDDQTFAYRDHCPVCDDSLAGAALHDGRCCDCPRCRHAFRRRACRRRLKPHRRSPRSRCRCWPATACCRWRCGPNRWERRHDDAV